MVKIDYSNLLLIGKIIGVRGIGGELVVFSYTSPINNLLGYSNIVVSNDATKIKAKIKSGYVLKNKLIVKLHDINNRTTAENIIQYKIYINLEQLPKLSDNEYYWRDLIGMKVVNTSNQVLGNIDNLMATGANDVIIVKPCVQSIDKRERLLPYTKNCVLDVDLTNKIVKVEWDADF